MSSSFIGIEIVIAIEIGFTIFIDNTIFLNIISSPPIRLSIAAIRSNSLLRFLLSVLSSTSPIDLTIKIFKKKQVSFALWGSLSKTWGARGKQVKVNTKGNHQGLKMFGVIDLLSGKLIYEEAGGKFTNFSYRNFLEKVMHHYSDRTVILIEDRAPMKGESMRKKKE